MTRSRLGELLGDLLAILRQGEHDVSWTSYRSAQDLIAELEENKEPVERGDPAACERLRRLCAPTGAIEEVAVSSGWAQAWLRLTVEYRGELSQHPRTP